MKKIFFSTFALLIVALFPLSLSAQSITDNNLRYVEVTASSFLEVAPDEFHIQIIIDESLNGNKSSLERKEKELFSALKGLGIDLEKDLQIQDVSSSLKNYILKQAKILNSKSYTLKVYSPETLLGVFNATEKIKISQVSVIKTGVSNPDKVKEEVLAKATAKAKNNASIIAGSLGCKLGKPIFAQNYDNSFIPYRAMTKSTISIRGMASEMASDEASPELEFEKIRFEQQVVIRFLLE